jgi:serine protease Do
MEMRARSILKFNLNVCRYLIVVFAVSFLGASSSLASEAPGSFSGLVEKFGPTVVNIYSTQTIQARHLPYNYFFNDNELPDMFKYFFDIPRRNDSQPLPEEKRTSLGSGVIISEDGYIVTNNHVVENADEINVRLSNYEEYQAKIIGRDKKTDLALIKIDPKHTLLFSQFGDSDELKVGDWVLAIGNPFGFEQTVTAGIVSGKGRSLGDGPYQNFIQTDASINPGNSGGPLFNMKGEMMGINTAIYSRSGGNVGLGFAIPAKMAKNVINQLKGTGKVSRGMLGVLIQPVTPELAAQFDMDRAIGALVSQTTPDSPAEKAGIKSGDIILQYEGREISHMNMLPSMVAQTPIGTEVEVVLFRNGQRKTMSVVIGELPEGDEGSVESPESNTLLQQDEIGLSVQEIDDALAESLELTETEGLLITDVAPGSAADNAALQRGDIILEAGVGASRAKVSTLDDLNKVIQLSIEKNKNILLLVRSGKQMKFALLKLEKPSK